MQTTDIGARPVPTRTVHFFILLYTIANATQIVGRSENFAQPSTRPNVLSLRLKALKKIADTLDTTIDYLINGDSDEKAKSALKDSELLQHFKAVEQMNDDNRSVIKKVIGAFITQSKLRQIAM